MLTKALPKDRFNLHRQAIGLVDNIIHGFAREEVLDTEFGRELQPDD